jgi:hypothetical protein
MTDEQEPKQATVQQESSQEPKSDHLQDITKIDQQEIAQTDQQEWKTDQQESKVDKFSRFVRKWFWTVIQNRKLRRIYAPSQNGSLLFWAIS